MRLKVHKVSATLSQQDLCCRPTASAAVQPVGRLPNLLANATPASPPQQAADAAAVPRADSAFAAAQPKGEPFSTALSASSQRVDAIVTIKFVTLWRQQLTA